eukprot:7412475-Lingulodinium_polyedra.AAC.1
MCACLFRPAQPLAAAKQARTHPGQRQRPSEPMAPRSNLALRLSQRSAATIHQTPPLRYARKNGR